MKKFFLCSVGCLGIGMAFYAGIWTLVCSSTGMLSWVGFAGCTSYFACGKKKLPGIRTAMAANLTGIAWAMFSIILTEYFDFAGEAAVWSAVISFTIIMQSKVKGLEFIPGAYIGSIVTFAVSGKWRILVFPIIIGILMGYMADITGEKLYQKIGIQEECD